MNLPPDVTDEITERADQQRSAFGSVRVEVTIATSRWRTSLFPDTRRGTYVLPVKKEVRAAEALTHGSHATVHLVVLGRSAE